MILKQLIINGRKYADYEVKGDTIYFKSYRNFAGANKKDSEAFLIHLVRLTDNVRINKVGFLDLQTNINKLDNVNAKTSPHYTKLSTLKKLLSFPGKILRSLFKIKAK
jgi:hypothetical protein